MKIYLAAKFSQKEEMRRVAEFLASKGHEVTSTWLATEHATDAEATEAVLAAGAEANVEDIEEADVLVTFSQAQGTSHTGGGRHWEFGYAYAIEMPVVIVGPKGEHVFHYLPGVQHVADQDALVKLLGDIVACMVPAQGSA